MATKEEILESIKEMSVLDLAELVKELEETFGVSAAPPMGMAPMPMSADGGGVAVAEVEEQTEFTVVLKSFGSQKINVIKSVRSMTTLGLKEAKEVVEGVPSNIKEGVTKDEAAEAKTTLEEAGGEVDIV